MGDLQNNDKMYKSLDNGGASYERKERGKLQVMLKPQKITEHTFKSWLHLLMSLLLASLEDINFVKAVAGSVSLTALLPTSVPGKVPAL